MNPRPAMNNRTVGLPGPSSLGLAAKLSLGLWALVPVLFPFYLFRSGLPQISSALVVLASIAALAAGFRVPVGSYPVMKYLYWFLWYVCIVNFAWAALSEDYRMLVVPLFYLFNGLVLTLGLCLLGRAGIRFLRLTQHAFAFAVLTQVLLLLILGSTAGREVIYFNNPNQLGYFALVSAAVVLTLADRLGTPTWYRGAILGMCLILVMVSTSFAAIGGFALLVVLALKRRPGMLAVAVLAFGVFVSVWETGLFFTKRVENEREELEGASFLSYRGYDRIPNNLQHIFLGAGEGNYREHTSVLGKHEIHSSYGSLLFCYGIVGTTLFILFLFSLSRAAGLRYAQYFLPVLLYGIAHQSLRSPMLWIFMAVLYGVGRSSEEPARPLTRRRRPIHLMPQRSTRATEPESSI